MSDFVSVTNKCVLQCEIIQVTSHPKNNDDFPMNSIEFLHSYFRQNALFWFIQTNYIQRLQNWENRYEWHQLRFIYKAFIWFFWMKPINATKKNGSTFGFNFEFNVQFVCACNEGLCYNCHYLLLKIENRKEKKTAQYKYTMIK